jgi:D-mannonate dehydratase
MNNEHFLYPSDTDRAEDSELDRVCNQLDDVQDQLEAARVAHQKLLTLCDGLVGCEINWDQDTVPVPFDDRNPAHCRQVVGTQHISYARLQELRVALRENKLTN